MVGFRTKKIKTDGTVGERLFEKRKAEYISLEKAAYQLKIAKEYLSYLERGEYDSLPGEVYAKNFIKIYSKFLGLDPDEMLNIYRRERAVQNNLQTQSPYLLRRLKLKEPPRIISRLQMLSVPKIFRNILITGIVAVCLLYIGVKVEAIIRPPELSVAYPEVDILTKKKFIEVRGNTEPGANLVINGQKIFISETGEFIQKVNLREGINEITVSAHRDHSKENIVVRRVVVESEAAH